MKKTALGIVMAAVCLTVTAGVALDGRADEMKKFDTRELEAHLRKTSKELKTMKSLEKKLESAARQSSNTARKSAINALEDHMAECIIRRETDLGQEHTIKMHGQHVTSGTTDAAEVGAPVGTKRGKPALRYKEGIAGVRLRQLASMQTHYVTAMRSKQPAIERQGESLERYATQVRLFREELERSVSLLEVELEKRAQEKEKLEKERMGDTEEAADG